MKVPLKSLWSEFKAFAFKGNMIDLAVAVVIGAAFSSVINSLVKDIIMPTVSYATSAAATAGKAATEVAHEATSKVGLTSRPADTQASETQPEKPVAAAAPPAAAPPAAPAPDPNKPLAIPLMIGNINIGNFIAELLNFVIVALAVFLIIVKLLGSVMKRVGGTPAPSEPTTKECPECLSVIPLKARRCPNCTSQLVAIPTSAVQPNTSA